MAKNLNCSIDFNNFVFKNWYLTRLSKLKNRYLVKSRQVDLRSSCGIIFNYFELWLKLIQDGRSCNWITDSKVPFKSRLLLKLFHAIRSIILKSFCCTKKYCCFIFFIFLQNSIVSIILTLRIARSCFKRTCRIYFQSCMSVVPMTHVHQLMVRLRAMKILMEMSRLVQYVSKRWLSFTYHLYANFRTKRERSVKREEVKE